MLTGESGAGKTTLLGVIAGLIPLQSGRVEVAGHVLDDSNADAWRARLSVMAQGVHFPDASLRDLFGGADPAKALTEAEASGVVSRLPDGLDTRLGATGAGISGGEARRIALARAIHTGRELLIADEPTADLDPETAARIIAALRRLQARGVTLLIASHDPALIAAMDLRLQLP